jgi:hypothetical protein
MSVGAHDCLVCCLHALARQVAALLEEVIIAHDDSLRWKDDS